MRSIESCLDFAYPSKGSWTREVGVGLSIQRGGITSQTDFVPFLTGIDAITIVLFLHIGMF